jgi:hypothetical protein
MRKPTEVAGRTRLQASQAVNSVIICKRLTLSDLRLSYVPSLGNGAVESRSSPMPARQRGHKPAGALAGSAAPHLSHIRFSFIPLSTGYALSVPDPERAKSNNPFEVLTGHPGRN